MEIIGIDVGGMSVKGAVVTREGKILCHNSVPTRKGGNGKELSEDIARLVEELLSEQKLTAKDIAGVGVGCPGLIDSKNGVVVFAGNLDLNNSPLAELVSVKLGMPVKLTNDANAAALGEAKFGSGKKYSDSILLTLGTGVGGGIVIDGKLFEGGCSAGAEIGHMVIDYGGEPCTCGRRGCFEAYSSATALIRSTAKAMEEDKKSAMWNTYTPATVNGKTAFEYCDTDAAAKAVVDWYIEHLACGITNLANVFRPQVIMLGGGVSNQGAMLTEPLQNLLDSEIMGGQLYAPVKVVTASLGNDAGALGAAALFI